MILLEGHRLTKKFGGLVAINDLSLQVQKDDLLGLIGPNGAGKTTLFNLITGVIKLDSGILRFKDEDTTQLPPYEICKRGIARTHQLVKPFLSQTVLQNALVGRLFGQRDSVSLEEAEADVQPILDLLDLKEKQNQLVSNLSILDRKHVEIARAIATKPELLLLDEPASGLNPAEMADFMSTVKTVHKLGVTVFIIEHVMRLVMDLCSRVVVIHHGEKIAEGPPAEIASDAEVIRIYLGEPI